MGAEDLSIPNPDKRKPCRVQYLHVVSVGVRFQDPLCQGIKNRGQQPGDFVSSFSESLVSPAQVMKRLFHWALTTSWLISWAPESAAQACK